MCVLGGGGGGGTQVPGHGCLLASVCLLEKLYIGQWWCSGLNEINPFFLKLVKAKLKTTVLTENFV